MADDEPDNSVLRDPVDIINTNNLLQRHGESTARLLAERTTREYAHGERAYRSKISPSRNYLLPFLEMNERARMSKTVGAGRGDSPSRRCNQTVAKIALYTVHQNSHDRSPPTTKHACRAGRRRHRLFPRVTTAPSPHFVESFRSLQVMSHLYL